MERMRRASVDIQGLSCRIPVGILENELTARYATKEKVFGGKYNGKFRDVLYDRPVFTRNGNSIHCGIGAILFLSKNNPFVSIEFGSINPERSSLSRIEIPELLLGAPKWRVNGKERFYFHESLEACRKNHCGAVKLPTGSGKTLIELTLGYNQIREIGTGIILVPTNTIKDQFINESRRIGINLRDYREWLEEIDGGFSEMLISLPGVLHNDMLKPDELLRAKLDTIRWIIGDEVHHAGCDTWNTIFMGLPNLGRSHGFSALPVEENFTLSTNFSNLPLEDALTISTVGPVIYEKSTKELKDFLNIPSLVNFKYTWPEGKFKNSDDWHEIRKNCKDNEERKKVLSEILKLLIEKGYNTIAHVGEKNFGEDLLNLVNDSRCVCWYGSGKVLGSDLSVEEVREKAGTEILGMICTSHAVEGLDLDSPLNAIILIEGRKPRQILQKCGRIVRPDEKPSVIINIMDEGLWVLPKHSKERRNWIQAEFDSDIYNVSTLEQLETTLSLIERR